MAEKNFYDLDYIIEINEKRLDEYTSAYQKVLERLTNIILIYSALTIFLIPIIQDISNNEIHHWLMYVCFGLFCLIFCVSLFFTIKLIIPIQVAYLEMPKRYYEDYRLQYEQAQQPVPYTEAEVINLLKASYINELETALATNDLVFRKKSSFYYNSIMYGLLSTLPYLLCLGFHISKKEDKIEKVQIVNPAFNATLLKIDSMAKSTSSNSVPPKTGTTTTRLPGVVNTRVLSSQPKLVKENSQKSSGKKQ